MADSSSVDTFGNAPNLLGPEASRDPVAKLAEILADPKLTEQQKNFLVQQHRTRFKNRRRMAYLSMACLLTFFLCILVAIWVDGLYVCTDDEYCRKGVLTVIQENSTVIVWISGFFTSIVGAYFGSTIIRPAS